MSGPEISKHLIGLSRLAQLEQEIREAEDQRTLCFMAVNDTHRVVPYDHAVIWLAHTRSVAAVSGANNVDRHSPEMRFFSKVGKILNARKDSGAPTTFTQSELPKHLSADYARLSALSSIWVPMTGPGKYNVGGIIFMRRSEFSEGEARLLGRLGKAYAHGFVAIRARSQLARRAPVWRKRFAWMIFAGVAVCALFLPVKSSILAPAKVVPIRPHLITAPLNGVIEEIAVKPNERVRKGRILIRFDPSDLRDAYELAKKRVATLDAELRQIEQKAFSDDAARGRLALVRAKLEEGKIELSHARERLSRLVVRAPAAGVVLYSDPSQWIGRPVKVGEKILSLANPQDGRLEIDIAIDDAVVATDNAPVEFFLATSPATPITASLYRISFEPKLLANQTYAYVGEAHFVDKPGGPRLGLTGTAKIYGEKVPLYYALLRKPIAALRRMSGQ